MSVQHKETQRTHSGRECLEREVVVGENFHDALVKFFAVKCAVDGALPLLGRRENKADLSGLLARSTTGQSGARGVPSMRRMQCSRG